VRRASGLPCRRPLAGGDILFAMSRALALRQHDDTSTADDIVTLHGVSWEDYERILEIRGDKSAPRITYLEGELEIMSPSKDHEQIKSIIGRLLESWCIDRGIEVMPFGSWTLKGPKKDRGAEADECYVFGTEPRERPHLAIEVEWSRRAINKLRVYEGLGVDEVWIWRKGIIQVYVFARGKFEQAERSRLLPDFDLELVASMLDYDTLTQAVRAFRKALEGR
jgi:Uma2 family endonuclease